MSIAQFPLQEAVYSALSNDNTLTSTLGAGIFDDVLEGTTYPFVELGNETAIDYSTKDVDGAEFTITLHVWSQYAGAKETKQIMTVLTYLL